MQRLVRGGDASFAKLLSTLVNILLQYAIAVRGGEKVNIRAEELVVGDVIDVKFGDRIPADIRITASHGFKVESKRSFVVKIGEHVQRFAD